MNFKEYLTEVMDMPLQYKKEKDFEYTAKTPSGGTLQVSIDTKDNNMISFSVNNSQDIKQNDVLSVLSTVKKIASDFMESSQAKTISFIIDKDKDSFFHKLLTPIENSMFRKEPKGDKILYVFKKVE